MSVRLRAFTGCGIELEYMIVDRDSLDVVAAADRLLAQIGGVPGSTEVTSGEVGVSNELALHQVEVKNPRPTRCLPTLLAPFKLELQRLNAALFQSNARLLGTGMHPWMDPHSEGRLWPHAGATIYESYDRIFGCRSHGWFNLQSMHVNLPFADDEEFERLHAAVRLVLPLVPALAASSPLADGAPSGYLDYRLVAYRDHQRKHPATLGAIIPDTVRSESEYRDQILEPMYRSIAPEDPQGLLQHEWLNARGAIARFDRNAIEIRLADAQEHPSVDLAIAAAVIGAVESIYAERWCSLDAQQAIPTAALDTILRACVRDAERAIVSDPAVLRAWGVERPRLSARDVWDSWMANIDAGPWGGIWDALMTDGTLARRILRAVGDEVSVTRIRDVYAELALCLEEGTMFDDRVRRSSRASRALER